MDLLQILWRRNQQQNGGQQQQQNIRQGGPPVRNYNNDHLHQQLQMQNEQSAQTPLRQLLDAVNMAILPHDLRLAALTEAAEFFDHQDKVKHDYELREGAANILYQKLSFALQQASGLRRSSSETGGYDDLNHKNETGDLSDNYSYGGIDAISSHRIRSSTNSSDVDNEISMIVNCLEMIHRASPMSIAYTWNEIGQDVLPIFVRTLERPFVKIKLAIERAEKEQSSGGVERAVQMAANREMKVAVQKMTKILAVYSLVPEAKVPIASFPGMLPVLVKIIDTRNMNRLIVHPVVKGSKAARKARQNNYSPDKNETDSSKDNRTMAFGANGIQGATSGSGLYMTESSRYNTIATLTNLAAAESNRMLMIGEPGLVEGIALVVHNERSDVARRCSALAIMNLSNGNREHVPELAGNELLLETLVLLLQDDEPETKRNAAVALFNVACADQNTVKLARYKDGVILEALVRLVSNDDASFGACDDTRTNAAEALFNMSCSAIEETTDRMANHSGLLESIAFTLRSTTANLDVKMYAAATLRRLSEIIHATKNCHAALLSALVKASSWSRTSCIAEAFLSQSKVEQNRRILVEHHGFLHAISKLSLTVGGAESDRVRSAAISTIVNLSKDPSILPVIAHHEGVMMALTRASYGTGVNNSSSNGVSFTQGTNTLGNVHEEEEKSDDGSFPSQGHNPTRMNQQDHNYEGREIQIALKALVDAM